MMNTYYVITLSTVIMTITILVYIINSNIIKIINYVRTGTSKSKGSHVISYKRINNNDNDPIRKNDKDINNNNIGSKIMIMILRLTIKAITMISTTVLMLFAVPI